MHTSSGTQLETRAGPNRPTRVLTTVSMFPVDDPGGLREAGPTELKEFNPMRSPLRNSLLSFTAPVLAIIVLAATPTPAQTPSGRNPIPRMRDGKPDLNGIWQVLNTADWDLEGQGGGPAPKEGFQLGAVGAIPPGLGVVDGGRIPYQAWALAKREENRKNWVSLDPEVRCYLPGIPRATYLPYPFQI